MKNMLIFVSLLLGGALPLCAMKGDGKQENFISGREVKRALDGRISKLRKDDKGVLKGQFFQFHDRYVNHCMGHLNTALDNHGITRKEFSLLQKELERLEAGILKKQAIGFVNQDLYACKVEKNWVSKESIRTNTNVAGEKLSNDTSKKSRQFVLPLGGVTLLIAATAYGVYRYVKIKHEKGEKTIFDAWFSKAKDDLQDPSESQGDEPIEGATVDQGA